MCPRRSLRSRKQPEWFGRSPSADPPWGASLRKRVRRLQRQVAKAEGKLASLRAWHDEIAFVRSMVQRDELMALFKLAGVKVGAGSHTAGIGLVGAELVARGAKIAALEASVADGSASCVYCSGCPTPIA